MTNIDDALPSSRFTALLFSLLLYIVVYPSLPGEGARDVVLLVFHTTLIIAGVWVLSQHPRLAQIAVPLAAVTLTLVWIALLFPGPAIVYVGRSFSVVFFVLTTGQLVRYLAQAKKADGDMVLASACGYLMIAIIFALMFEIVEDFAPGAFSIELGENIGSHVYYSLVTLTTLGYGDIAPVHPMARSLSTTEALIGQFYVAVIVARLIALIISAKAPDHD